VLCKIGVQVAIEASEVQTLPFNPIGVIRRPVTYIRRSRQDIERERRTGEDTLAEQTQLMQRLLSEMQLPFEPRWEIGSGDKIVTRPVFQGVLTELRSGAFDAVAVKELSRLGRGSYADMGEIYDLLRTRRIWIVTPWRVYDPQNVSDARQIRFELFLSREEFETTRERLQGARCAYAAQGRWMAGRAPYGYRVDPVSGRLRICPSEARWVERIFAWYGQGMTLAGISRMLEREAVPAPKGGRRWHAAVIGRMLRNPAYAGQLRFRATARVDGRVCRRPESEWITLPDAHEAIVDAAVLRSPLAAADEVGLAPTRDPARAGTAWLRCGRCGGALYPALSRRTHTLADGTERTYERAYVRCSARTACTVVGVRDLLAQLHPNCAGRYAEFTASALLSALAALAQGHEPVTVRTARAVSGKLQIVLSTPPTDTGPGQ